MLVFYLALTTLIDFIGENSQPSTSHELSSQKEVPWLVPVYWSSKFQELPKIEQAYFLKLNGKTFDCSNFDYTTIANKCGLLDWCTVEVIDSTFSEYKMKINSLVRSLVNELGEIYWTNQNLNSTFRTMESFERHELICGLKMTFPNLATKYREFYQLFSQGQDLNCKVCKSTFKRTFNVCTLNTSVHLWTMVNTVAPILCTNVQECTQVFNYCFNIFLFRIICMIRYMLEKDIAPKKKSTQV